MDVTTTHRISDINYTADHWELFDQPGRDECAKRLNQAFMDLVNAGNDRNTVELEMGKVLCRDENSQYGAADSEGFYMLERLCKRVFGE